MLAIKHEGSKTKDPHHELIKGVCISIISSFIEESEKDQLKEVGTLFFIFQEVIQLCLRHIFTLIFLVASQTHTQHGILSRKGSYFSELVNGFI